MVDTGRSQFLEMVDQRLAAETCAEADRLGQGVCIIDQIEVEGADERAPAGCRMRPCAGLCRQLLQTCGIDEAAIHMFGEPFVALPGLTGDDHRNGWLGWARQKIEMRNALAVDGNPAGLPGAFR